DARSKVEEELRELEAAITQQEPRPRHEEELGDLLFAIVNWARHLGLNAEESLRAASSKFERRFREMEGRARARGLLLEKLSAPEWDALWGEAKAS
ncbi:MAG TPA: MazG nucleotide pyrophosphohydrolase domain-containing protein, partial [Steroidobacteraceae bacterium]